MLYFNLKLQEERSKSKDATNTQLGWYQRHAYLNSPRTLALIYLAVSFFFSLLCVIIHFADPPDQPFLPSTGCIQSQLYNIIIQGVCACAGLVYYVIRLWSMQDAFSIKKEIVMVSISAPTLLMAFVVCFVFDWRAAIHTFTVLAPLSVVFITLYYPAALAILEIRRNSQDEDLIALPGRASSDTLVYRSEDIFRGYLESEETLVAFIEFCVKSWCVENVLFYLQAEKFKKLENSPQILKPMATLIYERYIEEDAPYLVNIENSTSTGIKERMKNEDFDPLMFSSAQEHIFKVMYQDTYVKWKRSKEFREIVPQGQTVKSILSVQTKKSGRSRKNSNASQRAEDILPSELEIKMEDLLDQN